MDQSEIQEILMEILYCTINENSDNSSLHKKLTSDVVVAVYTLAKKHSLAHLVARYIFKNKISVESEIEAKLRKTDLMAVYQYERMKYTFAQICDAFDQAGIAYIPLKGSVLRAYYPTEDMRTSCDIDILIHEADLELAIGALEEKNYRRGDRHYHDVSLYSPNKIHLELHFNIQENMNNLDAVLKDAWEYAIPVKGSQYAFSKDFFAFHIFAHMAYHFVSGGCGIRALLDIGVMEHKMGISYSCAKELLEKAGIYKFASEMSKLAEQCFTNNERDSLSDSILKYIFMGGVYGSAENHIAVDKAKTKSSVTYALKRLFPPYKSMIITYPFLKKCFFLLPFCYVARWIRAIFGGKSKRIALEMACANNMSNERIKEIKEICSHLGL